MQFLCCPAAVKAEPSAIYPLGNSGKEQLCNDAKPEELPKMSHVKILRSTEGLL